METLLVSVELGSSLESDTNAPGSVMAQYLFKIGDHTPTAWEQKGVAVACYTLVTLCKCFSMSHACEDANTFDQ